MNTSRIKGNEGDEKLVYTRFQKISYSLEKKDKKLKKNY